MLRGKGVPGDDRLIVSKVDFYKQSRPVQPSFSIPSFRPPFKPIPYTPRHNRSCKESAYPRCWALVPSPVIIVDFGHARRGAPPEDMAAEMAGLIRLLQDASERKK